jgi:hypothetical protein
MECDGDIFGKGRGVFVSFIGQKVSNEEDAPIMLISQYSVYTN